MPSKCKVVLPETVWHIFSEDGRMYVEDWFTTKRAAVAWANAMGREHGDNWIVRGYVAAPMKRQELKP